MHCIHLWREGETIRWWTPDATGLIAAELPPPAHRLATDPGHEMRSLRECLPDALAERIERSLPAYLHLAANLPEPWQRLPWEELRCDGAPLLGRLLAIRYATDQTSRPCRGEVGILNLLPRDDHSFDDFPMKGRAAAARFFAHKGDFSALSALVVVAHGSEKHDSLALYDHQNHPWQLPERRLPPLVILLACGDTQGNLVDYARRLLGQGAQAVLAPRGQIDAEQARRFLQTFLGSWKQGQSVRRILLSIQGETIAQQHSAARLQLLGDGALCTGNPESCFPAQLQQITLDGYRQPGGWSMETALQRLRSVCGIAPEDGRYGGESQAIRLRDKLYLCEAALPALTHRWVLGLIAYLSEVYFDRDLLDHCDGLRRTLDIGAANAPLEHYFWSKLYYRQGRYKQALAELDAGLQQLDPAREPDSYSQLLGGLLNILIDLDLPGPGERVYARLEDALQTDTADGARQRHNLHDRRARLWLRMGRYHQARRLYERKRDEAQRRGESSLRELIWLLYIGAWCDAGSSVGTELVREAEHSLNASEVITSTPTWVYLLRTLALWAWRSGDDGVAHWTLANIEQHGPALTRLDAGPGGMALAYLLLYAREHDQQLAKRLIGRWEAICADMENEGYWLELAVLHRFLGDERQNRRCLSRFHQRRRDALSGKPTPLFADLFKSEADCAALLNIQEQRELGVLCGNTSVAQVAGAGLMPL